MQLVGMTVGLRMQLANVPGVVDYGRPHPLSSPAPRTPLFRRSRTLLLFLWSFFNISHLLGLLLSAATHKKNGFSSSPPHAPLSLSLPLPSAPAGWWPQPKLGKVSNVVKASLEETLRSAKEAISNAAIEEEMEKDKIDVTLPG